MTSATAGGGILRFLLRRQVVVQVDARPLQRRTHFRQSFGAALDVPFGVALDTPLGATFDTALVKPFGAETPLVRFQQAGVEKFGQYYNGSFLS